MKQIHRSGKAPHVSYSASKPVESRIAESALFFQKTLLQMGMAVFQISGSVLEDVAGGALKFRLKQHKLHSPLRK